MSEIAAADIRKIEELFAKGQFDQALPLCQQLVERAPLKGQSWYWLGHVQLLRGDLAASESALKEAVRLDPALADAWTVLSLAASGLGRRKEAEEHARRAIALDGTKDFFWMNLGSALFHQERWEEAGEAYREAIERSANNFAAWSSVATVELKVGRLAEAQKAFERCLNIAPNPETALNYSLLLMRRGNIELARHVLRQIIEQRPTMADAWLAWGDLEGMLGDPVAGEKAYRHVLDIQPGHRQAKINLALALVRQFRLREAETLAHELVSIDALDADAWVALGSAQQAAGEIGEAIESFRRAVDAAPQHAAHSSWLLASQYAGEVDPEALLTKHREWEDRFGGDLASERPPIRSRIRSERPLRVGFVSANFSRHPVASLLLGAIEQLDRSQCTAILYYDRFQEDLVTERFKAAANEWQVVRSMTDEELAELVRRDEIDVLIDLMGHTGLRLPVFARKPAPMQATWLGYVGTTGLSAIDYLIADRYHVRPGEESWYQEKVLRLPNSYAVYSPPPYLPEVNLLPAKKNGWFTFGSLSNPAKLSAPLLEAWAEILVRTKDSRLLLHYAGLDEVDVQSPIRRHFEQRGIAAERLIFQGNSNHPEFLAGYHEVDLALDTQPYSGGVTTCEALWMGVPVVTFPGRTFAGRHATSYLTTAGLAEFVAADLAGYVEMAVGWRERVEELNALRGTLRERVSRSPLAKAKQFAADFVQMLVTAQAVL